ncbi:uncharacterized protein LOC135947926 [Cloeon dipterum]|uniref:uncharacterized protein LOC135947926 n=1 Tax=Cloeon dipterum TaxID=197152 RepID=UPI003220069D
MAESRTVLAFTVALILAVAAHDHAGKRHGLPQIMRDLDKCCEAPMPLCHSNFEGCKMKHKSAGGERTPPTPYQRMCMMECAFKNFNYSSGGNIDVEAMKAAFVNSVNSTWQTRARESVDFCVNELKTKFQSSAVPAPPIGEKVCDATPGFLMICMHVRYYATCSPDINTSACASNLEKLVKMDYMDLLLNGDSAASK